MEAISASNKMRDHDKPTGYGRACTNCSRIKGKCIYRIDGSSCERCHRLKKDCQTLVSVRKRNAKTTHTSRTAQLEEKLDDIVSLLRSQGSEKPATTQYTVPPTINQDASPYLDSLFRTDESTSPSSANVVIDNTSGWPSMVPLTPVSQSSAVSPSPFVDEVSVHQIPESVAEAQLNTFRFGFLQFFPFVHIPESTSASHLRHQRPFLWLVIMSLTTKSVAMQVAMRDTIRQLVLQKVVADSEKSMDILLGMICYLGWFHHHKKEDVNPYMILWSQLAVSVMFQLKINKDPAGEDGQLLSSRSSGIATRISQRSSRTMEERRAVLGTYIISSIVWTSLRQTEPIRWTSYMDDCVSILSKGQHTDLDTVLATQAKCHVIMDLVTCSSTEHTTMGGSKTPSVHMVKALQLQLKDIRRSLPPNLQSHRAALLSIVSTEIIVTEAVLSRPVVADQTSLSNLHRLEGLEAILTVVEQWFELFFSIPLLDWIGASFASFAQFTHCTIVLFKLTALNEPGWDTSDVKKRCNLLDILERFAENLDKIPGLIGMVDAAKSGDSGLFFRSSQLIRGMKATVWAEMGLDKKQTTPETSGDLDTIDMGEAWAQDGGALGYSDFAEGPWFNDFFGMSWET